MTCFLALDVSPFWLSSYNPSLRPSFDAVGLILMKCGEPGSFRKWCDIGFCTVIQLTCTFSRINPGPHGLWPAHHTPQAVPRATEPGREVFGKACRAQQVGYKSYFVGADLQNTVLSLP